MPDKNGYPTELEIRKFKRLCKFDFFQQENIDYFLDYLSDIWWMADWGFKKYWGFETFPKRKKVLKLELSTGGRDGNEEIIGILQQSIFWLLYWKRSERGGHYEFEIPLRK